MPKQKITTFLWFDTNAEEAVNHYMSCFTDSKINRILRHVEGGPGPAGTVLTIDFELAGQEFIALNGGPMFQFTEAISLLVNCESQEEVDHYWESTRRRGRSESVWLAEGQVRSHVADRPHHVAGNADGQGSRKGRSRDASDDADGEARHFQVAGRLRRQLNAPVAEVVRLPIAGRNSHVFRYSRKSRLRISPLLSGDSR